MGTIELIKGMKMGPVSLCTPFTLTLRGVMSPDKLKEFDALRAAVNRLYCNDLLSERDAARCIARLKKQMCASALKRRSI